MVRKNSMEPRVIFRSLRARFVNPWLWQVVVARYVVPRNRFVTSYGKCGQSVTTIFFSSVVEYFLSAHPSCIFLFAWRGILSSPGKQSLIFKGKQRP
ncbi:hypothetical protein MPTK1_5g13960 [Marchantia polymorpha subsp. ruderalis]|uniref:Uncharacterized protein n=2 Tax=Marchantia polymorpha TaxID=3197 RepID=A0AAF6BI51_MARPO|nr:hypothetical protein MARPO_0032s0086 [Marchantia polymorpha]BBN11685.1 hypothetical protein Mp_5g13960 [Marchantia polymorpha subsp. ruderalis]|eukprot:PTQ41899.1 hypothetical protein MARPO_0032s0086 [Marchantia polymorpha]